MSRIARFCVVLLGLLLIVGIWCSLRKTPQYLTVIHAAFGSLAFLAGTSIRTWGITGLLLILASAPMFGSGLLSFCTLIFTVGALTRPTSSKKFPSLTEDTSELWMLVLPFVLSVVALVVIVVDWGLLSEILNHGGGRNLFLFLFEQERSKWFREISFVLHLLSLVVLFAVVRSATSPEKLTLDFKLGIVLASLLAGGLFLLQLLDLHPIFSMNQSSFWVLTGRYSGAFSDPNAHGIISAMLLPILCVEMFGDRLTARPYWRALCGLAIGVTSLGALWSGSRTFWIAIALTFFFMWRKRGRRMLPRIVVLAVALFILLTLIPQTNRVLQASLPLPGVVRLLKTLELGTIQEMFLSRATYNRLAFYAWLEKPLTGHGLFRFYEEQTRIAADLGINLDGWRDNANNFYLQVLSESGLIGFLALCLGVILIRRRFTGEPSKSIERSVLGAFLLALLTGPHVLFEEVRVFIFLLLTVLVLPSADYVALETQGRSFANRRNLPLIGAGLAALYLAVLISQGPSQLTRGLYAFERDEAGHARWSGLRGEIAVCRNVEEESTIEVKSVDSGNPPEVVISLLDSEGQTLFENRSTIQGNDWNTLDLPRYSAERGLRIEVSKAFLPNQGWGIADYRALGVRVRWSGLFCEQPPEG